MTRSAFSLRTNRTQGACDCDGDCGCGAIEGHSFRLNLSAYSVRRTKYEGRDTLIVPVVMLRETVANGAFIAADQLIPQSWNGVPVTVHHPKDGADFASANEPETLSRWHVGRIFKARMDGDKLKAEAWIDTVRANKVAPGLIKALETGEKIDVSTGYFSDRRAASGTFNGKKYNSTHHDLKPDHLALLPGAEGACSWGDGCGIRANEGSEMRFEKFMSALQGAFDANARGDDHDPRQIMADLIGDDRTPFTPDDESALRMMSQTTLRKMRKQFLTANQQETAAMTKEERKALVDKITANCKIPVVTLESLDDAQLQATADGIVPNETAAEKAKREEKEAAEKKKPAANETATALSAEDREAVDYARTVTANARAALVEKIVAGTEFKADELKTFSLAQLESMAGKLKPAGDYSARANAAPITALKKDDPAASMVPVDLGDVIRANAQKKQEAA